MKIIVSCIKILRKVARFKAWYQENPMELVECRRGIYLLGGRTEVNGHQPVLAVHPYYSFYQGDDVPYSSRCEVPERYMEVFEELFRMHEGPIVTLEGLVDFGKTMRRYGSMRTIDRYMILTKDKSPETIDVAFEELLDFLRSLGTAPLKLVGGRLYPSEAYTGHFGGCLGTTKRKLEEAGLQTEVVDGLTFS